MNNIAAPNDKGGLDFDDAPSQTPSNADLREKLVKLGEEWMESHEQAQFEAWADEALTLFRAERQRLLSELMASLPEEPVYPETMEYVAMIKQAAENGKYDDMYDNGFKAACDQVKALITKYMQPNPQPEPNHD